MISREDISEIFGESHHCENLKFENFNESQLKMVSIWTHLVELQVSLTEANINKPLCLY